MPQLETMAIRRRVEISVKMVKNRGFCSVVSSLNVYVTVLKLNYLLVHNTAYCFCGQLDLCSCQPFKLWILNRHETVDIKFTTLSLKTETEFET